MSALVSQTELNSIGYAAQNVYIPWKGKTFNQITSKRQKNGMDQIYRTTSLVSYFRALPMKIYRREIVTNQDSSYNVCNSRSSSSIDLFNMPGSAIVNSSYDENVNGLVNTIGNKINPNNSCESPGTCLAFLSPSETAKRRVRSAGMIKRQFDISKNNDTYYTNTNQYLVSRNRTFKQNQYNYIQYGDATVKPGDGLSSQNVYAGNGINHCPKYYSNTAVTFQYQWLDKLYYTVTVPIGYYAVEDLNNVLHNTMIANNHYFVNLSSQSKVMLLSFSYNSYFKKMELHTYLANTTIFSTVNYRLPYSPLYDPQTMNIPLYITSWSTPTQSRMPIFVVANNGFQEMIGFSAGSYPSIPIPASFSVGPNQDVSETSNVFMSSSTPAIQPTFVTVVYKPSNSQFATQGGVSASSLTARVRYNTITNNSAVYMQGLGVAVGNAMAYGVPENGYTIKDKLGYPLRRTPFFKPFSTSPDCITCNTWNVQATTKLS